MATGANLSVCVERRRDTLAQGPSTSLGANGLMITSKLHA